MHITSIGRILWAAAFMQAKRWGAYVKQHCGHSRSTCDEIVQMPISD